VTPVTVCQQVVLLPRGVFVILSHGVALHNTCTLAGISGLDTMVMKCSCRESNPDCQVCDTSLSGATTIHLLLSAQTSPPSSHHPNIVVQLVALLRRATPLPVGTRNITQHLDIFSIWTACSFYCNIPS
jgi:hypothetical protein